MENNNNGKKAQYNYPNSEETEIDFRTLFFNYARHWYWFLLGIVVALIFATLYLKTTAYKYSVQTTVGLTEKNTTLGSQMSMLQNLGISENKEVEDEIQVFRSLKLIRQAIEELELQTEYFQKKKLKYVEQYGNIPLELYIPPTLKQTLKQKIVLTVRKEKGKIFVNLKVKKMYDEDYELASITTPFMTPYGEFRLENKESLETNKTETYNRQIIVYPIKVLLQIYAGKLNVATVNKQSNVIKLSIVEENVKKATDFLDKLVHLYNMDAISNKNILANNTAEFIAERLKIVGQQLSEAESNVEMYKKSQNLTDISSEASIYLETANEYNKKLAALETQKNMIESVENYVKNPAYKQKLIPSNIVGEDPTLAVSIQEYNKLLLEQMKLSQSATSENPILVQMNNELGVLRNNVLASIATVKRGLDIGMRDLKKKDIQFNAKIKNVPTQERQYFSVKRQQEIKQTIYLFLLQRQEDIALQLASTEPAARTIDKAYETLSPVSPKKPMIYLIAIMLGLILPFVVIYLRDLFNNTIEDPKSFRKMLKAPYLGSIGVSREQDRVVVKKGKLTPVIEMFSLIRTNIQFMVGSNQSPVIMVTSTISGEGKSFFAINLSMSLALTKKKVVLVGLDIRNPMLIEYMKINEMKGISLYLSENVNDLTDLIIPSGYDDYFDIVPAGPIPPNPAELLLTPKLDKLMDELRKEYDYIIVDTAPVGVVTDTYLLDRIADMSIFVARKDYTPLDAISLVNEIYSNKKLKNISVVLNGTNENTEYGYSYGYRSRSSADLKFKDTLNDKLRILYKKLFRRNR